MILITLWWVLGAMSPCVRNLLISLVLLLVVSCVGAEEDGEVCNIERRTHRLGEKMILPSHPVIFETAMHGMSQKNIELSKAASRVHLSEKWGSSPVRLTSSNALSHGLRDATLQEYLDMMQEESESSHTCHSANETWYLFGNNEGTEPFKSLATMYEPPSSHFEYEAIDEGAPELQDPTVVIGLGRRNSGLSFHFHGPGLSQAILGRKRWFLYRPGSRPRAGFDALVNVTLAEWSRSADFGSCTTLDGSSDIDCFFQCTIDAEKGEVLYFPAQWYHATLNVEPYTLFVSVFL
jgi:hypothetical protein